MSKSQKKKKIHADISLAQVNNTTQASAGKSGPFKAGAIIAVLLCSLVGFGALVQWNNAKSSTAAQPPAPPSPTPDYEANKPTKQYIYAGGKLLAVEEGSGSPPADIAVWRPSTGVWYVMGSQGSQQTTVTWGVSTDRPVPGDYDGDDKTDFSVYRPASGEWFVLNSSDATFNTYTWGGQAGDMAANADYDGDSRTDVAIYRPSTGVWSILKSSDGQSLQYTWGTSSDVPVSADYDGDGKADIGVWRSSNTTFYSLNSSDAAQQTIMFSNASTEPVSGDYDGDGKADYAIKSGNSWIIRNSSTSQFDSITWQQAGDKPVHNDYDGDSKVDIAVWRESTGGWFIRQSSKIGQVDELRQNTWGAAGDIPVPAFYRR